MIRYKQVQILWKLDVKQNLSDFCGSRSVFGNLVTHTYLVWSTYQSASGQRVCQFCITDALTDRKRWARARGDEKAAPLHSIYSNQHTNTHTHTTCCLSLYIKLAPLYCIHLFVEFILFPRLLLKKLMPWSSFKKVTFIKFYKIETFARWCFKQHHFIVVIIPVRSPHQDAGPSSSCTSGRLPLGCSRVRKIKLKGLFLNLPSK